MRASRAPIIEEGIHRDLPEPRKFGFALANANGGQAVVSEAIVQSIRPESVSIVLGDGDRGDCRSVVGELSLMQKFQGIGSEVEERRTETLDRLEWDTSESIEGNDVSVDLFSRRSSDVGHSRIPGSRELRVAEDVIRPRGWRQWLGRLQNTNCSLPRCPENPKKEEGRTCDHQSRYRRHTNP
jgi:hypothetical protein